VYLSRVLEAGAGVDRPAAEELVRNPTWSEADRVRERVAGLAINAEWHEKHPMPKPATLEQRIRWHEEHAKECGCAPIPGAILIELERRERRGKKKWRPRR